MSKLEMVKRVPEESQHQADAEGVIIQGGKIYTCADDGKVKFIRPKAVMPRLPEDDLETVILHGERVLTCSDAGKVKIFDSDLTLVSEFKANDYAVYDIIAAGDTLFTCSIDSTIKMWDMNTLELKKTIEQHEDAVRKFCTDGKLIYAGDEKGEVRGYTLEGELAVTYNVVEEVWSLYAKEDLLYTVRDRGITISQVRGEDNKYVHYTSLDGRAPIYARGDWLVFPDISGLAMEVHDNNKASSFATKGHLKGSEMIITAIGGWGDRAVSGGWDNVLRLWDLNTCAEIGKCPVPDLPNGIAANDQGDIFVVGVGGYICKLKWA